MVYGLALLIGVLSGGRDILQPLDGFGGKYASEASSSTELQFERVTSLAELESQIQAAEGRYVMLDFWADWCVSCHEMERFTLSDERVKARLKDVLLLKADVTPIMRRVRHYFDALGFLGRLASSFMIGKAWKSIFK